MNPTNVCQTQPDHSDIRLRSRLFAQPLPIVANTIIAIIPTLHTYGRAWKITSAPTASPQGELRRADEKSTPENVTIRAEVPVIVFTDDLVVTLSSKDTGTLLDVRSASRVGRSDFGENRRHVLQLLAALGKTLKSPA